MHPFAPPARSLSGAAALLCSLALRAGAWAQPPGAPEPAAPPSASGPPTVALEEPWRMRVGVRLSTGVPEGLALEALVQPRPWLRVHAGAARNSLGVTARAGVELLPARLLVSPVLGLAYGHGFSLDYAGLLSRLHGQPTVPGTRIRQVDAEQLSATVGLEYSPWRPLTLVGGVGISYWFIRVPDVADFVEDAVDNPAITSTPLRLGLSTPVARLGLLLHFN